MTVGFVSRGDRRATVIVAAGAPFATTSYARARLLRQLHATGASRGESTAAAPSRVSVDFRGSDAPR